MNDIEIRLTFEYYLKQAKPATNSSIIYVDKGWLDFFIFLIH